VSAISLRKKTQLTAADMHMGWKKSWQLLSKDQNHPRFDWHIQRKFPMNHLCLTCIVIEALFGKSPYYSSKKFTTIQIKKITTKQKKYLLRTKDSYFFVTSINFCYSSYPLSSNYPMPTRA
jgi:hypothetical protein